MLDYITIGNNIRSRREGQHLTRNELATFAKCSLSTLYNIETGRAKAKYSTLRSIAKALNTTTNSLMGNQETEDIALDHKPDILDDLLFEAIAECDDEKKELILRIIKVL